jgi:transcriptional regulator of arginine metabolism
MIQAIYFLYIFAANLNIYSTMQARKKRLEAIRAIVRQQEISNQEELLIRLTGKGFSATQATLSRDIKLLKIIKSPNPSGQYVYQLPEMNNHANSLPLSQHSEWVRNGFISIAFSGNLAVVKTRPGYAMGIASDIDQSSSPEILGTIAGDDTILIILQELASKKAIIETLNKLTIDNQL